MLIDAIQVHAAGVGPDEAGQNSQRSRFARAVGSDEPDDLTGGNGKRHAHAFDCELSPVALGDALDTNQTCYRHASWNVFVNFLRNNEGSTSRPPQGRRESDYWEEQILPKDLP